MLTFFHPRLEIIKNVKISFVPLIDEVERGVYKCYTGEESIIKQGQTYYHRPYSKGFFVTRLRIRPIETTNVYYWYQFRKEGSREEIYGQHCSTIQNKEIKSLTFKGLNKLMKKKMKKHYLSPSFSKI